MSGVAFVVRSLEYQELRRLRAVAPLQRGGHPGMLAAVEDLDALKERTAEAVLRGPGTTTPEQRAAVARGEPPEELRALVEKIRLHAYKVTDEDLDALRGRYSEDQLFELVVSAVLGAADTRLRAGLRALEEACD